MIRTPRRLPIPPADRNSLETGVRTVILIYTARGSVTRSGSFPGGIRKTPTLPSTERCGSQPRASSGNLPSSPALKGLPFFELRSTKPKSSANRSGECSGTPRGAGAGCLDPLSPQMGTEYFLKNLLRTSLKSGLMGRFYICNNHINSDLCNYSSSDNLFKKSEEKR